MVLPKVAVLAVYSAFIALSLVPSHTRGDDPAHQLVGTWKLTTWTVQVVGETSSREPYGPNPKGRLVLTRDGHWIMIVTGAHRMPAKTAEEKAALLDSLLAYSGKYRIEGDVVTVRVDMSSNEIFAGANQEQTRFFKIDGDKLTLRTPEIASAALPGKRLIGTLTWNRER